jgi:putative NADPH-quinone reductase
MPKKVLIIVSDSNQVGISYKLLAPTIKLLYSKKGWDCEVIDLYSSGFDPVAGIDTMKNMIARSYKNSIKKADNIHFISNVYLGGISPVMEGFFQQVISRDFGFEYNGKKYKSLLKSKNVFFHLNYNTKLRFKFNPTWARIKFDLIPKVFGTGKVFQSDINWVEPAIKNREISKLIKYLKKII